jgi:hypothetical protein
MNGKQLSEGHMHKISLAHKGKKITEEHRANISRAHRNVSSQIRARLIQGMREHWKEYFKTHKRKVPKPKVYAKN